MHTPFYRHVFRDAWHGSWRNRSLWILGLFSAFWGVTGLQMVWDWYESVFRESTSVSGYRETVSTFTPPLGPVSFSSIAAFVTLVALCALMLWIVTAARGGVYWALYKTGTQKASPGVFQESLRVGTKRFWPVLWASLAGRVLIGGIFVGIVAVVAAIGAGSMWSIIANTLVIVSATMVALFVGIMTIFTTLGIVVNDMGFMRSFREAYRHLRRHVVVTVESVIFLYLLNAAAGILILVVAAALFFPLLMMLVITSVVSSALALWFIAVPVGVVVLAALLVLSAWYATFEAAAWTSIYRRTYDASPVPKLYRIAALVKAKITR